MRTIVLLLFSLIPAMAQASLMHDVPTGNPFPVWRKYTVTKIANGSGGCASANGCWQVNGGTPVTASSSGLTQNLTLTTLPANGFVHNARVKSATACTGITTLVSTLGTTASSTFFVSTGFDLMASVSNTNLSNALLLKTGSDTAASTDVVAGFVGTGIAKTLADVADGCSFSVWLEWSVLP